MGGLSESVPMMNTDAALTFDVSEPDAVTVAATDAASVAATGAVLGRMRPERIKVMLSSDRRREHGPELRAQLVAEMMSGGAVVSDMSRCGGSRRCPGAPLLHHVQGRDPS